MEMKKTMNDPEKQELLREWNKMSYQEKQAYKVSFLEYVEAHQAIRKRSNG